MKFKFHSVDYILRYFCASRLILVNENSFFRDEAVKDSDIFTHKIKVNIKCEMKAEIMENSLKNFITLDTHQFVLGNKGEL